MNIHKYIYACDVFTKEHEFYKNSVNYPFVVIGKKYIYMFIYFLTKY